MIHRVVAIILAVTMAAVVLFLLWMFSAHISHGWSALVGFFSRLTWDNSTPSGLSDGFAQGVYVNFLTGIVQALVTFFLVSLVISRKEKRSRRKIKRWLATRLRDELFSLIISARQDQKKRPTIDPMLELIQKTRIGFELQDWNAIQRFEDSLHQFLHFPKNIHYRALVSESFDNLLRSLSIGASKRRIYTDRIAVAFSYS